MARPPVAPGRTAGRPPDPTSGGRPRAHEPDCLTYRRIYLSDVGILTDRICCCARIRAEQHQAPDAPPPGGAR